MDLSVRILNASTNDAFQLREKIAPILIEHGADPYSLVFERGTTMSAGVIKIQIFGYKAGSSFLSTIFGFDKTTTKLLKDIEKKTGFEAVILS